MGPSFRAFRCFTAMTAGGKLPAVLRVWFRLATALFAFAAIASSTNISLADEGGISFWIPGFFGSLAAAPQQPGWSLASIYYHTDVSTSGNAAVAREITIGQFNPKLNASVNANVHGVANLGFVIPTYVFATPFLGGQASASLLMAYGNNDTSLNATATGTIGPIPFTKSIALQQDTMGFADLVPQFAVRWNAGVNNYMARRHSGRQVQRQQFGEYRSRSWRARRRVGLHLFRSKDRSRVFSRIRPDRQLQKPIDGIHEWR
jgi:hypothetical protein